MKAYKGFNRHEDGTLWCRNFQYEIGKTYKFEGEPVLCTQGFHACHGPWQCWTHYPNNRAVTYYEVECGGKIIESDDGDGKFVCTEITLVREIPTPENKFDWCSHFQDDRAIVRLNDKYNYINIEGKYLFEQWWDSCLYFHDGYAIVYLNGKYNYINSEGKYLSLLWFDSCSDFQEGYARVRLNGRYNYINTKGKYISEQWWDWCGDFHDGYAIVMLNGKNYKIDKTGKIAQL